MNRSIFPSLVFVLLAGTGSIHAQILDHPITVPVQFQGEFDTTYDYWFYQDWPYQAQFEAYLAGAGCSGYANDGGSFATDIGTAQLRPGKDYEVVIYGNGVDAYKVHFNAPPGYRVILQDETRRLYDPGYDPLYGNQSYVKIRLEGGAAVSDMPAGDSTGLNPGRTVWQVGLGKLGNGKGAGSIGLREDGISGDLGTRNALFYDSASSEVEIIYVSGTAQLRQVYSLQALVDITDETNGVRLSFYPQASYSMSGGVYVVSGATPFVSYKLIKDSSTQFTITRIIGAKEWYARVDHPDATHWNLIDWTENLSSPVRKEERSYSTSYPYTYEDIVVKNGSNTVATTLRRVFQDFGAGWGKELVEEIQGYGTAYVSSTYEYHTNSAAGGNYRKLKKVVRPDDSWTQFAYYDALSHWGMLAATYEPFADSPASGTTPTTSNCRYTTFSYSADHTGKYTRLETREEWTNSARTGKSVTTYQDSTLNSLPVVIATRNDYSDPSTVRTTISKFYRDDADSSDHWYPQLPTMVETAGGQRTVYAYTRGQFNPTNRSFTPNPGDYHIQEVIVHGSNSSAGNVALSSWGGQTIDTVYVVPNKSWLEENIRGTSGVIYYKAFYVANGSGSFVKTNGLLMPHTSGRYIDYQLDDYGRYHNQWTWEYGRIKQHTDENGVVAEFSHDYAGRVTQEKRLGIAAGSGYPAVPDFAVDFEYDGDHRLRYRREGPSPQPTYEWQYDQAGRLISKSEPGLAATTISYPSVREVKFELPGPYMVGDTETTNPKRYYLEERYRDGTFKRRTGNATPPAYREYYLDAGTPTHGRILEHVKRSSSTTDEWHNTWFDWLGRATQQFGPTYLEDPNSNPNAINVVDFYYCGCGRLERTTNTSPAFGTIGAPMKYEYDAMGNLSRRVADIDQDNVIDYGGSGARDRIEKHDTSFQEISSAWWLVEKVSTYPKLDDSAERRVGEQRTKLSGFSSGQVAVTQSIDAPGNMTQTVVRVETSGKRRFVEVTAPDASTTAQTIWVDGRLWKDTSQSGVVTTYEYDSNERVTNIQGRQNVKQQFTYYSGTYLVYQKLNHFFATDTFEYDNAGRVIKRTAQPYYGGPDLASRFAYDAMGNLSHRWGQTVQPVKFQYDAYGRRTYMWTYQQGSNWNSTSWPSGSTGTANQTYWDYQEKTGLLIEKQDAAGRWTKYEYNIRHQLAKRSEQRGSGSTIVTDYAYWEDADTTSPSRATGELKTVDYPASGPTTDLGFTYDRLGRMSQVTDVTGSRQFSYQDDDPNAAGGHYANLQLKTEVLASAFYGSNELRRRFQTGVKGRYEGFDYGPSGSVTHGNTYQFDSGTGRISTVQSTSGPDWGYGYLSGSNLVETVTAGSTWQRTNYWQSWRNLLDGNAHVYGGSANKASHWSDTDWFGRRLNNKLTGELPTKFGSYPYGIQTDFTYTDRSEVDYTNAFKLLSNGAIELDGQNQPVQVSGRLRDWTYDTAMNRTGQVTNTGSSGYTRNNLDQITAITDEGAATLTFDYAGNLTEDADWIYSYDAENRPYHMERKNQNTGWVYAYDHLGRRVSKTPATISGGTWTETTASRIKFVYDGWNLVAETDNSNAVIRSYTWGLDASGSLQGVGGVGGLLHFREGTENYLPMYDASHNIVGWSRQSDGEIMAATAYSPFGEPLQQPWEHSSFTGKAKFGFSTKYTDSETGLVYYGFRYYNPKLGRFINRDPIGDAGGFNLYALVGNNPVNQADLLGLCRLVPQFVLDPSTENYEIEWVIVCDEPTTPETVEGGTLPPFVVESNQYDPPTVNVQEDRDEDDSSGGDRTSADDDEVVVLSPFVVTEPPLNHCHELVDYLVAQAERARTGFSEILNTRPVGMFFPGQDPGATAMSAFGYVTGVGIGMMSTAASLQTDHQMVNPITGFVGQSDVNGFHEFLVDHRQRSDVIKHVLMNAGAELAGRPVGLVVGGGMTLFDAGEFVADQLGDRPGDLRRLPELLGDLFGTDSGKLMRDHAINGGSSNELRDSLRKRLCVQ